MPRRTLTALLTLLPIFAGCALQASPDPQAGRRLSGVISHVTDGDTLELTVGELTYKIRLDGIDAPEGGQAFSVQSRQQLRVLGFLQQATVEVRETDRYGRLVGRVVVANRDLSEAMIGAGMAWHFRRYSSDPRLASLEKQARARRAGLWADPSPVAPWDHRARSENGPATPPAGGRITPAPKASSPPAPRAGLSIAPRAVAGPYHGNVKSLALHAPGCRDYNCKNCTIVFTSLAQAQSAGYRPHACVFEGKQEAR